MRLIILLVMLSLYVSAFAQPPSNRPPDNRPPNKTSGVINNDVNNDINVAIDVLTTIVPATTPVQDIQVESTGGSALAKTGDSISNSTIGDISITGPEGTNSESSVGDVANTVNIHGDNYPRQTPDGYFNYTPNYLNCGRVIGLQYGNPSGIGSFGIPWFRDRTCDIWLAVNEAQENGHILLSYAFMCEIRNIREIWGKDRCNEITDTANEWWIRETTLIPPIEEESVIVKEPVMVEVSEGYVSDDDPGLNRGEQDVIIQAQQVLIETLRKDDSNLSKKVDALQYQQQQREESEEYRRTRLLELLENDKNG